MLRVGGVTPEEQTMVRRLAHSRTAEARVVDHARMLYTRRPPSLLPAHLMKNTVGTPHHHLLSHRLMAPVHQPPLS